MLSIKPARWCKYWWCTILPQIFADIWGQVSSDQSEGRVFLCLHMHFFSCALHVGWEALGSMSYRILLIVSKHHPTSHWFPIHLIVIKSLPRIWVCLHAARCAEVEAFSHVSVYNTLVDHWILRFLRRRGHSTKDITISANKVSTYLCIVQKGLRL